MMLPAKDIGCHRTGFEKDCRVLVTDGRCTRWRHLLGSDPQTGAPLDVWDCLDNHDHVLKLEIAKAAHEGAKATLDFRNAALDPEIRARQAEKLAHELKPQQIEAPHAD